MKTRIRLGVIVLLESGPREALSKVKRLGFSTCQISCWNPDLYTKVAVVGHRRCAGWSAVAFTP